MYLLHRSKFEQPRAAKKKFCYDDVYITEKMYLAIMSLKNK